ncbi:MAG: Uma2 family endonuclease [Moorea sp. SIO2I5]|nr:Uma2 family endonuclease [Moorena sp. SIO2I5]
MTSLPYRSQPLISPRQTLPTMYDLPSENPNEPGLPDEFHFFQPLLLLLTFAPANSNPELVFSASDLNLYYDLNHPGWYKRPDWFGVVGVPRLYESKDLRLSYVIWQEQVSPFVVVELLSPGTEDEDYGQTVSAPGKPPTKWQVYEQILRVPYYVIFSRYTNELQGFHLVGDHYKPAVLNQGRLLMPELGLSLGLWRGSFRDIPRLWLRWMTLKGNLIPLASEELAQAQLEAIEAKLEAIEAKQRAERLAARLRELGINPDQLD